MMQLGLPSEARKHGERFCVDPSHGLFSNMSRGYVNVRSQAGVGRLLRGHGDTPTHAARRIPSSRVHLLRVPEAVREVNEAFWRCAFNEEAPPSPAASSLPASSPAVLSQAGGDGHKGGGDARKGAGDASPMRVRHCMCSRTPLRPHRCSATGAEGEGESEGEAHPHPRCRPRCHPRYRILRHSHWSR